jgi:hypothetical protein
MPDIWPEDDSEMEEECTDLWFFLRPSNAVSRFVLIIQEPSATSTVDLHLKHGPLLACLDIEYHASKDLPAEKADLQRKLRIYLNQLRADVKKELLSAAAIHLVREDSTIESPHKWSIRTTNYMSSSQWGRDLYETACQVAGKIPYKGVVSIQSECYGGTFFFPPLSEHINTAWKEFIFKRKTSYLATALPSAKKLELTQVHSNGNVANAVQFLQSLLLLPRPRNDGETLLNNEVEQPMRKRPRIQEFRSLAPFSE